MHIVSAFSRVFPPPRFMTLPSAGVDISDASLKYIQFARHHHSLRLERWGDLSIPPETVNRGNLVNKDNLTAVLKDLRKELNTEFIRVSLPEERAYLFETTLEKTGSVKDMRNMVEFRLEENVPMSPRDALFDFAVVGKEPGGGVRVSVAVYARDTIAGYYEVCRAAGFVPLSFEVEAQAIARAVIPADHVGTHMIVDFGQTRTGIGIVHKGMLMFTATIEVAGAQLSDAMRRVLGQVDEKKLTKIKNEQGLLRSAESEALVAALIAPVAALKDELNVRINYWNMRGDGTRARDIEKVILCGGSANLAGLTEYLTEELGVPTERGSVWMNAFSVSETVPPITRRYSYGYATAIGLALTDFIPDL